MKLESCLSFSAHPERHTQASLLFQTLRSAVEENMWGIWMSDPPLPLHSCSLLPAEGGGEGHAGLASLDEVITAYQWQRGGRPADLWADASGVKSRGLWIRSWPPWWRRVLPASQKIPHFRLQLLMMMIMMIPSSWTTLTLSIRLLLYYHIGAESVHYMVQISPWGGRLLLPPPAIPPPTLPSPPHLPTLPTSPPSPPPSPPHTAPRICFIFFAGCDSHAFVLMIHCQRYIGR